MKRIGLIYFCFISFSIACTEPIDKKPESKSNSWYSMNRLAKNVDNITYIFPADVPIELRDSAIRMNERAIKANLDLLGEQEFTDTIKFEFFHTREEMKLTCGYGTKGLALPRQNAMYSLMDLSERSPIQHEMMHIILTKKWGNGYSSMRWFNEGLATFSGGMCGQYNFGEVYAYMFQNNHLIEMDVLVSNFYDQDEVIGYTQSAFIVKYLSENYGWQKVKQLWQSGFSRFENIFGLPYADVEIEMHRKIASQFPHKVELNWTNFIKGCPN